MIAQKNVQGLKNDIRLHLVLVTLHGQFTN